MQVIKEIGTITTMNRVYEIVYEQIGVNNYHKKTTASLNVSKRI